MDVNSVSSNVSTVATSSVSTTSEAKNTSEKAAIAEKPAVVYEKSDNKVTDSAKKTYTQNTELVNKMKADQQARMDQLQSLVNTMMSKQGKASATANAFTSEFWKTFAQDGLTIDEAAVKQAQEDVSEDGYWGVKQTSERILDFAKALTGGDPAKIDEMQKAFEKGYAQATKAWGDELPELSKNTYDAVMSGFQSWKDEVSAE